MRIRVDVKVFVRSDKIDEFPLYPTDEKTDGFSDEGVAEHVRRVVESFYGAVRYDFRRVNLEDGIL